MTRREFFAVGAPLEARPASYLEDCHDADIWANMAVNAIANYAALSRSGFIEPRIAIAAMLALSDQE